MDPQPRTMFSGFTFCFFAIASIRSRELPEYRPGLRPPSPNAACTAFITTGPGPSGFSLLASMI